MERFAGIFGFLLLIGLACLLSTNRRAIKWRFVLIGSGFQLAFACLVLKGPQISAAFDWLPLLGKPFLLVIALQAVALVILRRRSLLPELWGKRLWWFWTAQLGFAFLKYNLLARSFVVIRDGINKLIAYSAEGASFVFGPLGMEKAERGIGFVFAFQVLPTIIFVSSTFAILYYLGVMQFVVRWVAKGMNRLMGVSGAESVSVAASIFMGQTEAPLTVRPFLQEMTKSELMTIMTTGMAHVSGGIMAAYVLVAHVDVVHLLTAVIMTAPGAIMVSKIMVPETEEPKTKGDIAVEIPLHDVNIVDAAARGASEGVQLAINVAGMLIAFLALVALANGILSFLHDGLQSATADLYPEFLSTLASYFPSSLQQVLGVVFRPLAWAMGVTWEDASAVGNLLGTRMVLNEFVSFLQLGQMNGTMDPRSFTISTFALCGFANFSSIAIQVGGIGALVPSRRHDLAALGIRAMLAGTIANFLSATLAGIIL